MSENTIGPVLRYLTVQERPGSRNLWEEAFPEDSKEFADYYFVEKIKDNRILVLEEHGRIDAMIQLNPYLLRVKDVQWKSDYLVGVATRNDRRHRGYMRRLLMRMMADMRAENMPFCFLMPADEAIYRPFGFTFIFDQPWFDWKKEPEGVTWISVSGVSEQVKEAADWMNRWLDKHYQVYAVRDTAYVERLVKELASENGTLNMAFKDGQLIGLQSFWGLAKKVQRLLYTEDIYAEEVKVPKPAIMARIIDVERFVSVIGLRDSVDEKEKVLILKLDDPLVPENHGVWKWTLNHNGSKLDRITCSDGEAKDIEDGRAEPELTLTVTEMTSWLFGYDVPAAVIGLADWIEPLQGVFLDEVV